VASADPRRHVDHVLVLVNEVAQLADQGAGLLHRAAAGLGFPEVLVRLLGLGSSRPADHLHVARGELNLLGQPTDLPLVPGGEDDAAGDCAK
jgi:hypothetical protein